MKKTKLEERIENAFQAFFDNERLNENRALEYSHESAILQVEERESFAKKNRTLINILKQVFLFFPGAYLLFVICCPLTIIAINNPLEVRLAENSLPLLIALFLASIPMTWFGLGNLRKKEDCIIPLSIITTSILLGIFSGFISMVSRDLAEFVWNGTYMFYLLPIALIIPNLVKLFIDSNNNKNSL